MNIVLVLLGSLIIFMVMRAIDVGVIWLGSKLNKTSLNDKWNLGLSIAKLFVFISAFLLMVSIPKINDKLSAVEFYMVFVLLGISSICWCYFSWSSDKVFTKPTFEDEERMLIKKIVVFSLVFAYTVVSGYKQLVPDKTNLQLLFKLSNFTVIASIIALDRVLNQIYSYYKKRKGNKQLGGEVTSFSKKEDDNITRK